MGRRKPGNLSHSEASQPRGVIRGPKGVAITPAGLPMSDHFFQATGFRVKKVGSNLHMVFGAQTAFADQDEDRYRLAIEIVFPVHMAVKFIYALNWVKLSISGKGTFSEELCKSVEKSWNTYEAPRDLGIPLGPSFRSFPSNFAIMALSAGQGSIEFFEAPPGMLVDVIFHKGSWRPNSDVRAILTVVLPPIELYRFLLKTKEILEPLATSVELEELVED